MVVSTATSLQEVLPEHLSFHNDLTTRTTDSVPVHQVHHSTAPYPSYPCSAGYPAPSLDPTALYPVDHTVNSDGAGVHQLHTVSSMYGHTVEYGGVDHHDDEQFGLDGPLENYLGEDPTLPPLDLPPQDVFSKERREKAEKAREKTQAEKLVVEKTHKKSDQLEPKRLEVGAEESFQVHPAAL